MCCLIIPLHTHRKHREEDCKTCTLTRKLYSLSLVYIKMLGQYKRQRSYARTTVSTADWITCWSLCSPSSPSHISGIASLILWMLVKTQSAPGTKTELPTCHQNIYMSVFAENRLLGFILSAFSFFFLHHISSRHQPPPAHEGSIILLMQKKLKEFLPRLYEVLLLSRLQCFECYRQRKSGKETKRRRRRRSRRINHVFPWTEHGRKNSTSENFIIQFFQGLCLWYE